MTEETLKTSYMIKDVWKHLQRKFGCNDKIHIMSPGDEIELRRQVLMDAGVKNDKLILDTIITNMKLEDESGTLFKTIFHPHVKDGKLIISNHVVVPTESLWFIMSTVNTNSIEIMIERSLRHEMGHCLCNHELFDSCESMSELLIKRSRQVAQRQSDVAKYNEKWKHAEMLTDDESFEMICDYYKMITDERDANHRIGLTSIEMGVLEKIHAGIPTNIINHIPTDD